MDLAMAVGAKEDALLELGFDLVPAPRDAFGRDAELLPCWIQVMELECIDRLAKPATGARSAHGRDRPTLRALAKHGDRMRAGALDGQVPDPVAIRANKSALLSFAVSSIDAAKEPAERKELCLGVSVMEIERPHRAVVATVFAATALARHELELDAAPASAAIARRRLSPTRDSINKRSARRISGAKRRACRAEAAAVQVSTLAVDQHSRREGCPARSTDLHT